MVDTGSMHGVTSERAREKNRAKRLGWYVHYQQRMRDGLERCRNCHAGGELTFGHLIPRSAGGAFALDNLTILCKPCNMQQGEAVWPHLRPLSIEYRPRKPKLRRMKRRRLK